MNTATCRDCGKMVSVDALACPQCGAPRPANHQWNGEGYEWKSPQTWMGWPLVHIAFGIDRAGRPRTARGVIAIGQRAVGGFAFGILSAGLVAMGIVSFGVISAAVVAIGVVAAFGVNAIAPLAFGVVAIGVTVGGIQAIGWKILFSVGR